MMEPVFSTAYSDRAGGLRIWLPLGTACILGLWGLFANRLAMTAFSALCTAYVLWNWPYSDPGRVVLRLTEDGVDIDGIGHVAWARVAKAEAVTRKLPKAAAHVIRIKLTDPPQHSIDPSPAFSRPKWQRKLGKVRGNRIDIPSGVLFVPPEDVAAAFERFLGSRFRRVDA